MHHFAYRNGVLHAEDVSLEAMAAEVGTPVYVYSTATLERHYRVLAEAMADLAPTICYALKANPNLAVVATLARLGAGADTVSEGEIRRALAAGVPASRIVYSGVGKTEAELAFAVDAGIHQVNVETPHELETLNRIARARGKRQKIVFRVNPDVGAGGHAKITTGSDANKFGVSFAGAAELYAQATNMPGVEPVGLAVHIGSQIHDLAPFETAFAKVRRLAEELRAAGHRVERLDLGGGLGVFYDIGTDFDDGPDRVAAYADLVRRTVAGLGVEVSIEPGRLIVGNAGILLARVVTLNPRAGRSFVVVDAGMNDLVRPAMYEAFHAIWPVREPRPGAGRERVDVVGPICESGDTFATERDLPPLAPGDLVAFMTAGAYGASMSSTYNARPLVPEVLVRSNTYAIVRRRQSYEEMLGSEAVAPWLTAK